MAVEQVFIPGINSTKWTSYGVTYTNGAGYHDRIITSQSTYDQMIARMGDQLFTIDHATYEKGGTIVWETMQTIGHLKLQNCHYDPTPQSNVQYPYSVSYGVRLMYDDYNMGAIILNTGMTALSDPVPRITFGFILDEAAQKGYVVMFYNSSTKDKWSYYYTQSQYTQPSQQNYVYNILVGNIIHYQAVNYITGNNKTYNLSKINSGYINGGDPVSGAAAASVTLNNNSRLDNLIQNG